MKKISDLYSTSSEQMTLPGIPDPVNKPSHYCDGKIEPIDVFEDWAPGEDPYLFYLKTQILKYLKREKSKGKLQDIEKAAFFMNRLVEAGGKFYA